MTPGSKRHSYSSTSPPSTPSRSASRSPSSTTISPHSLIPPSSPAAQSMNSPSQSTTSTTATTAPPIRSPGHIHSANTAICPTDEDTIVPRRQGRSRATAAAVEAQTEDRGLNKQSWEYVVKSGFAGGLAGCAAKTVVGPLDRVKILFQTHNPQFAKYSGSWSGAAVAMRGIWRAEGARGLFRGHSATLLRIFPYAGIKFLAYEQIRHILIPSRDAETHIRRFASGSLAGCVSVFFTYPLEVIRVRLAFETKTQGRTTTLRGICRKIYHERTSTAMGDAMGTVLTKTGAGSVAAPAAGAGPGTAVGDGVLGSAGSTRVVTLSGLPNFFRGFTATMCGMLPYAGASFLVHDGMSDVLRHPLFAAWTTIPSSSSAGGSRTAVSDKPPQLKYWAELSAGGVAGLVSQTVSYPLEVIRRRMQVGGVVGDGHRLGMGEVAGRIWRESGWRGFFVGLGIGYAKVIPLAATSFFVYERAKWKLGI